MRNRIEVRSGDCRREVRGIDRKWEWLQSTMNGLERLKSDWTERHHAPKD